MTEPYVAWNPLEVGAWEHFPFPYLGPERPEGWDLIANWLCVTDGIHRGEEPSWSENQLRVNLAEWLSDPRHSQQVYGFAILEQGPRHFRLGIFRKHRPRHLNHRRCPLRPPTQPYDVATQLAAYERSELNRDQTIELFQQLIDTGLAWKLKDYGRQALRLIDAGLCHEGDANDYETTAEDHPHRSTPRRPTSQAVCRLRSRPPTHGL